VSVAGFEESALVDSATVRDDDDNDQAVPVFDGVDDPIVANTITPRPSKRSCKRLDIRVPVRLGPKHFEAAVQTALQRRIGFLVKVAC
jgi:hypothetical protein